MAVELEALELKITHDTGDLNDSLDDLTEALKRSGNESEKTARKMQTLSRGLQSLNSRAAGLFKNMSLKALGAYGLTDLVAKSVKESNAYIENLNLFNVAMGKYADSAKEYADTVSDALGIDPSAWMRQQGVFMTLGTGFGVASDKAALMSKNLTQLAYDISSFYNIGVDVASQKLESAFAGELEPVRRLGYDLSQTRLQQVAYSQGIRTMVQDMTQAEKSQLRYIALIEQVSQSHGDLARTINTPANQIRILQAQITQLVRAIGNLFIPILNAILPYINAFIKALRNLAQTIASFFGYTLPEVDYSTVVENNSAIADSIDDTADAYSGATKAAKAYKNTILGIDEIHKLNDTSESFSPTGGGSASVVGGGDSFAFDLPEYDFLAGWVDGSAALSDNMSTVLNAVGAIAGGLLAWKVATDVTDFFNKYFGAGIPAKISIGLGFMVAGAALAFNAGMDIGENGASWGNVIESALGVVAAGIGGALTIGGPLGWGIGISVGLIANIVGIAIGEQKRLDSIWKESEAYKEMSALLDDIKSNEEIVKNIDITLKAKLDNITSIEDKFNIVRKKVDEMFKASDMGADVEKIRGYIDEINGFEIEGLELDYSDITKGKDEIYELIDALEKQAIVQGYQEYLTDAYRELANAEIALAKSERDNKGIISNYEELEERMKYLQDLASEQYGLEVGFGSLTPEQLKRYNEIDKILMDSETGYKQTEYNLNAAKPLYDEAQASLQKQIDIIQGIQGDIDIAKTKMGDYTKSVNGAKSSTDKFGSSGSLSVKKIKDAAVTAASKVTTLGTNANTTKSKFGTLGSNGKTSIDKITSAIGRTRDAIRVNGGLSSTTAAAEEAFKKFGSHTVPRVQKIRDAVNDVNTALAKLKFPEMTSTTVKGTTEWYIRTNKYAQGGYPEQGQLFLAREAGPEMVGTIGGHTAVANNQDIVAGISHGVFNAMRAAGGNGGTTIVQVVKDGYVESEQIISSADRRNRRDGKTVISVGS